MELFKKSKKFFKSLFKKSKPKKSVDLPAKVSTKVGVPTRRRGGGKPGETYKTLKEPRISEKATYLSDQGKYTFKVFPQANKIQIKKAVTNLYGVKVKNVKIISIKPKKRMLRGTEGTKSGYKKAIVTLERGEKIEILPH